VAACYKALALGRSGWEKEKKIAVPWIHVSWWCSMVADLHQRELRHSPSW